MADADYAALDDGTLIRLIALAREDALSELYDRYVRLVFSLALNVVGDASTAEEITQDVFVRVWEHATQYRADLAGVSTWLTSITRHRAIDALRRTGARPDRNAVTWAEVAPAEEPAVGGPEVATTLALESARVRAAVSELSPEQKQVLVLAYFQGLTQSQIAEALGMPLGTVKTRVRLAMQHLRAALGDLALA
ncbi:MAG: sigma-70 family RNA polymerase sigma factor [Anaerolineae bacterium]|nr:sigma-70 family RNA polymerase sigma factor [Anaerolineae bacterium]